MRRPLPYVYEKADRDQAMPRIRFRPARATKLKARYLNTLGRLSPEACTSARETIRGMVAEGVDPFSSDRLSFCETDASLIHIAGIDCPACTPTEPT